MGYIKKLTTWVLELDTSAPSLLLLALIGGAIAGVISLMIMGARNSAFQHFCITTLQAAISNPVALSLLVGIALITALYFKQWSASALLRQSLMPTLLPATTLKNTLEQHIKSDALLENTQQTIIDLSTEEKLKQLQNIIKKDSAFPSQLSSLFNRVLQNICDKPNPIEHDIETLNAIAAISTTIQNRPYTDQVYTQHIEIKLAILRSYDMDKSRIHIALKDIKDEDKIDQLLDLRYMPRSTCNIEAANLVIRCITEYNEYAQQSNLEPYSSRLRFVLQEKKEPLNELYTNSSLNIDTLLPLITYKAELYNRAVHNKDHALVELLESETYPAYPYSTYIRLGKPNNADKSLVLINTITRSAEELTEALRDTSLHIEADTQPFEQYLLDWALTHDATFDIYETLINHNCKDYQPESMEEANEDIRNLFIDKGIYRVSPHDPTILPTLQRLLKRYNEDQSTTNRERLQRFIPKLEVAGDTVNFILSLPDKKEATYYRQILTQSPDLKTIHVGNTPLTGWARAYNNTQALSALTEMTDSNEEPNTVFSWWGLFSSPMQQGREEQDNGWLEYFSPSLLDR